MKNIFWIINKEKIYAYIVSIMTIMVIFFMSNLINTDLKNTELTVSNGIENIQDKEKGTIGEAVYTSTPYSDNSKNTNENSTEETNNIEIDED